MATDTSGTIDIVDARSEATIATIPPHYQTDLGVFFVIGYTPTAIFLAQRGKNPPPGVWKIDTSTWALSKVASKVATWTVVDGSTVWGTFDAATGYGGIERLDTSTGAIQDVSPPRETRFDLAIAGLAGSGVLMVSLPSLQSAEVVDSNGSSQSVAIPPALNGSDLGFSFQNGPDILFAASAGLVAYDPKLGFQLLVSRSDMFRIVGACETA